MATQKLRDDFQRINVILMRVDVTKLHMEYR